MASSEIIGSGDLWHALEQQGDRVEISALKQKCGVCGGEFPVVSFAEHLKGCPLMPAYMGPQKCFVFPRAAA